MRFTQGRNQGGAKGAEVSTLAKPKLRKTKKLWIVLILSEFV